MPALNQSHIATGDTTIATATSVPATGPSIFWAIAALAINAMLQPSVTGYFWSNDHFESSLWPHRSSPIVCLIDTMAELLGWLLANTNEREDEDHQNQYQQSINRGAITLRLAIFCIGVLPQAIKLFSMRGIPLTQLVAAAFLASSIPGMVRTTRSTRANKPVAELAKRLHSEPNSARFYLVLAGIVGIARQIAMVAFIWRLLDAHSWLSDDLVYIQPLIQVLAISTWVFALPFAVLAGVFRAIKLSFIVLPVVFCNAASGFIKEQKHSYTFRGFFDACYTLLFVGSLSFVIAYTLYVSAACLRPSPQAPPEVGNAEVQSTEIGSTPNTELALVSQTTPEYVAEHGTALRATGNRNAQTPTPQTATATSLATSEDAPGGLCHEAAVTGDSVGPAAKPQAEYAIPFKEDKECRTESELSTQAVSVSSPSPPGPADEVAQPIWNTVLRYILWSIIQYIVAWHEMYDQAGKSIGALLALHDGDVGWITFAIMNGATAALYYLPIFDGTGTVSPHWVTILG